MRILITLGLLVGLTIGNSPAVAELPLEEYGRPATVSSMAISPDATLVAFRRRDQTMDAVFVQNRETHEIVAAVHDFGVEVQQISFLDQDRLLLRASENRRIVSADGRTYQITGSFVFDIRTNRLSQLLSRSSYLRPRQLRLGRIIGHDPERDVLYMPAAVSGVKQNYTNGILEVALDSLEDDIHVKGNRNSLAWFVGQHGEILVEEENDDGVQRIWGHRGEKRVLIYESDPEKATFSTIGLSRDRRSLIVSGIPGDSEFEAYYEMNLADGSVGSPLYHREDRDIEHALMDINRVVYGVEYSGFFPRYEFFDSALTERVRDIQSAMKSTASYLVDWTPDFKHLVFRLSGEMTSGAYVIVGPDSPTPELLAFIREGIPAEAVAPTAVIQYVARDGLQIPALVTARADVRSGGNAPLIVLPHGGPAAYDRYEFEWLSQYFASRGMVVLKPQFRGSTGFGIAHWGAGQGERGAKMSTDLDDGVQYLIDEGLVDSSRVCIVGHSYGGYAALAAGAFSKFDYKCLVAVAGVSDVERMKDTTSRKYVGDWRDYGKTMTDRPLDEISPVNFAKNFRSSVLLIHGRDDTVIPYSQSKDMEKALRRAKVPVQLVRLKNEDHYLSGYETRLEALRAIAAFIDENL